MASWQQYRDCFPRICKDRQSRHILERLVWTFWRVQRDCGNHKMKRQRAKRWLLRVAFCQVKNASSHVQMSWAGKRRTIRTANQATEKRDVTKCGGSSSDTHLLPREHILKRHVKSVSPTLTSWESTRKRHICVRFMGSRSLPPLTTLSHTCTQIERQSKANSTSQLMLKYTKNVTLIFSLDYKRIAPCTKQNCKRRPRKCSLLPSLWVWSLL